MHYDAALKAKGVSADCIWKYGFAFRGKEVLTWLGDAALRQNQENAMIWIKSNLIPKDVW